MKIYVSNFYNWEGYHIIDALLNEGYQVTASITEETHEFYLDFFNRNSHFKLATENNDEKYDAAIILQRDEQLQTIHANKYLLMPSFHSMEKHRPGFIFGEWMPMNATGVYIGREYISFDSERFQQEAIYIADVVQLILQWIDYPSLQGVFECGILEKTDKEVKLLEKMLFLKENILEEKMIETVRSHYKKHIFLQ